MGVIKYNSLLLFTLSLVSQVVSSKIENLNKIVKPLEPRLVTFGESEFTDWTLSKVKNEGSFTICSVESEEKSFRTFYTAQLFLDLVPD